MTSKNTPAAPAAADVERAISELTKLGRTLMTDIGRRRFSFFDNGVTEGSGIWGEQLGAEFPEAKNVGGVVGRLVKADLLTSQETGEQGGSWVALTALGAAVAVKLAEEPEAPAKAKATNAPAKATKAAPAKSTRVPAALAPADKIAAFKKERAAYEVPAGYVLKYPHPSYDLLRKADKGVEGPAWWVVCTAHGTFAEAAKATEGDKVGGKAGRPTWCKGCKTEAARAAKTAEAATAPKEAAK